MIDREHDLSITRQAKLLEISRGTVYYLPRPVSPADLALMRKLDELHLKHPFMGARKLRDQLARQGVHAGRRHIRTLMLRMGIEALASQPGMFEPLKDVTFFAQAVVHPELKTVTWPNGADLAPEFLYQAAKQAEATAAPR